MTEQPHVDLMRPAPGIVRCCICFEARPVAELLLDKTTGQRWDICAAGNCARQAGLDADGQELCSHCGKAMRGNAGMSLNGRHHHLCHPDEGMDCYRLVTVYQHPVEDCPCVKGEPVTVRDVSLLPTLGEPDTVAE